MTMGVAAGSHQRGNLLLAGSTRKHFTYITEVGLQDTGLALSRNAKVVIYEVNLHLPNPDLFG